MLLSEHGVPWSAMLCNVAACFNKLKLLQWLNEHACPWDETLVLVDACMRGNAAMLQWLLVVTAP
jgi:hypothetical protein